MSDLKWSDLTIENRPALRTFVAGITIQIASQSDANDDWYAVAGGEIFNCGRVHTSDVEAAKLRAIEIAAEDLEEKAKNLRMLASTLKKEPSP